MNIFTTDWKVAFHRLISSIRLLFIITIIWEFFLTAVIETSQRAFVLVTAGLVFKPFIIGIWLICMLGLIAIFTMSVFRKSKESRTHEILANISLFGMLFVYIALFILSVVAGITAWPLVIGFAASTFFLSLLIFFRKQLSVLEKADMV